MAFIADPNNLVPQMTSFTSPSGTVTESSHSNIYASWGLFDRTPYPDLGLWQIYYFAPPAWFAYEFTSPKIVNKISLYPLYSNSTGRAPKTFTFDGWDGSSYSTLLTVTNYTGWDTVGETKTIWNVNNKTPYIKYRVNITAINGSGGAVDLNLDCAEFIYVPQDVPRNPSPIISPAILSTSQATRGW